MGRVEYFVFDLGEKYDGDLAQCIGLYSISWWRYLLVGMSSLGDRAFKCFVDDDSLAKYLSSPERRVKPSSIDTDYPNLRNSLLKEFGITSTKKVGSK